MIYGIGTDITRVKEFYDRGARYMSLAHNNPSQLSDSNTGENDGFYEWNDGLSPLGKQVIVDNRPGASNTLGAARPHVRAGFLRAFAVTTTQRNPSFPDIPTAAEAGVAGYDFSSWGGVFAPRGTPAPVLDKLNQEFQQAVSSDEVRKKLYDIGYQPMLGNRAEFEKYVGAEKVRLGRIARDAKMSME